MLDDPHATVRQLTKQTLRRAPAAGLRTCGGRETTWVSASRVAVFDSEVRRTICTVGLTGESTVRPRLVILARGVCRACNGANKPQSEHSYTHRAGS